METFLGYYGLEENTTYFDELEKNYSNVIYKDADGNTLWDPTANNYHIPIMATDQKELQHMLIPDILQKN